MIGLCSMLASGQTLVHCDHIFICHLLIWVVDEVASTLSLAFASRRSKKA